MATTTEATAAVSRAASAAPQLAEAVSRQSYFDALTPMTMAPSFAEYMRRKAEP